MRLRTVLVCSAAVALAALSGVHTSGARAQNRVSIPVPPTGNAQFQSMLQPGQAYGVLISAPDPGVFPEKGRIFVHVRGLEQHETRKALHAGDPDWYFSVVPEEPTKLFLLLTADRMDKEVALDYEITVLSPAAETTAAIGGMGRSDWRNAQQIRLDVPVYASGDHRPYIPAVGYPEETYQQMLGGVDWYTFDYQGEGDRLLHLNVEVLDRDVPADVALFTVEDGKPVEYTRGRERFAPEKSTVLHGLYKFAPRMIKPGKYYVRVMANHPAYKLELNTYDPPPYDDPQKAVRVAMDYIVRKGDAWHANVPRRGMSALRTANVVQETKLCIACHPTHFSTRAEMIAVENGYPVQAKESLRFLVERLMQNPRPIYGHTEASWARMIHAPGNVLSRVAYIANKYERDLVHERRDELYRGIAAFLELYWPGMTRPEPESNGNLPRVSGFEVAHHSALLFRDLLERTGQERYRELANQAAKAAATGEPIDMLDLAWQTVALADLDADKYRATIDKNVAKIFELQKADGSWAMPFGMEIIEYDWRKREVKRKKIPQREGREGPRSAEFQTYHTLYALAKAGVPAGDPHVKKAIAYALSHQTPSGAWQGEPEYKNFDTPFRDTQYAIMALSEYFPGPKGRGHVKGMGAELDGPFVSAGPTAKLAMLDALWERPDELTAELVRGELDSPHVLLRRQVAIALGRYADVEAIEPLAKALGDASKLVQRAAAWSLRQIAMRSKDGRADAIDAIREALQSENPRVRWGATRVFNQHFKYISEEWPLAEELIRLSKTEPVPAVKMQAIQGLYQWFFWDRSLEHKGRIEEALIAGLGREEHPWVRRNFIEGYYNVLDDNLRYLYGSWMVRIKRDEDRKIVREGHQDFVKAQAMRFDAAMRAGNELMKDGLLRALHTHVLREGQGDVHVLDGSPAPETVEGPFLNGYKWFAVHDPLTGGTGTRAGTGNDSDPPKFYEDSAPLMNDALLTALDPASPQLVRETLRVLDFLAPFPVDEALAERMLALVGDTQGELRADVAAAARKHLPGAEIAGGKTAARLAELAAKGDALAVETVAAILRSPKQTELAADAAVRAAIAGRLQTIDTADAVFPHLLAALTALPQERQDPALVAKALAGLAGSDGDARKAALTLLLEDAALFEQPEVRQAWDRYLASGEGSIRDGLELVGSLSYEKERYADVLPRIEALVLAGMAHPAPAARQDALSALRTIQPLQDEPAVNDRLGSLLTDSDPGVRNSAVSLQASLAARAGRRGYDLQQLLDYEFFKYNVEPILARKASDGLACVNCHANHTVFKLHEPDEFGVITHADSRANYNAAIGVVNVADPENSLLVNKPTHRLDDVGVGDSQRLTHGGGLRWPKGRESEEYRTILRWIQGERLGSAAEHSDE